jgi:uncharacterized protein YbaA (DUF1428 family)
LVCFTCQKRKIGAYEHLAHKAGKIGKEHTALEFRECVADDMDAKFDMSFTQKIKLELAKLCSFLGWHSSHVHIGTV